MSVFDIGCNGGFYSLEMKRRGAARVVGINSDPGYLAQARFAAAYYGVEIDFLELSVYHLASLKERFDLVLFLGVFYHLRYPLLALDLIRRYVAPHHMLFQSMVRGDAQIASLARDYPFEERQIFFVPVLRECSSSNTALRATQRTGGFPTARRLKRCCAVPALRFSPVPKTSLSVPGRPFHRSGIPMIEAAMFWNEPNNKSHWAFELDPGWSRFATMTKLAAAAVAAENPRIQRVLGGISPIDPTFILNMDAQGVLDALDVVAVHGFPLDWNHWRVDEWPAKLASIQSATARPVWVTEAGASSFGAEQVQEFGLRRSAQLLLDRSPRIHWYSFFDLPKAWPATTRHREAEGSAYYRHFYMDIYDENGRPKRAACAFREFTPQLGGCQWIHFEDPRLGN